MIHAIDVCLMVCSGISLLVSLGHINEGHGHSVAEVAALVEDMLICMEMFVCVFVFLHAYPVSEYLYALDVSELPLPVQLGGGTKRSIGLIGRPLPLQKLDTTRTNNGKEKLTPLICPANPARNDSPLASARRLSTPTRSVHAAAAAKNSYTSSERDPGSGSTTMPGTDVHSSPSLSMKEAIGRALPPEAEDMKDSGIDVEAGQASSLDAGTHPEIPARYSTPEKRALEDPNSSSDSDHDELSPGGGRGSRQPLLGQSNFISSGLVLGAGGNMTAASLTPISLASSSEDCQDQQDPTLMEALWQISMPDDLRRDIQDLGSQVNELWTVSNASLSNNFALKKWWKGKTSAHI
jgi:hypothetical protein